MVRAANRDDMALSSTLRQVTVAIDQVAEAGTVEQKTAAEALLAGLRRQVYLLLAGLAPDVDAAGDNPSDGDKETWKRVEDYFDAAFLGRDPTSSERSV